MRRRKISFITMAAVAALVVTMTSAAPATALTSNTVQQTIQTKTGAAASLVTVPQVADRVGIDVGRVKGKALKTYAQKTSETARLMSVIDDASQGSVDFNLTIPTGASVEMNADGSAVVLRRRDTAVEVFATIAAPWAIDAAGKTLPTSYSYSNGVLSQRVDTERARFPVVADPTVQTGFYYMPVFYITFTRAETLSLWSIRNNVEAVVLKTCAPIPSYGKAVCRQIVKSQMALIKAQLVYANSVFHRCFKARMAASGGSIMFTVNKYYTVYC